MSADAPLSSSERAGAVKRRLGAALAGLALMVGFALLPARDGVDPLSRDTCIAVVPALEPEGRIAILAVEPSPERRGAVRVTYRTNREDTPATEIDCFFGDPDGNGRGLLGVRTEDGLLPLGRFFALKRYWLTDRAALAEGLFRVGLADNMRPSVFARVLAWMVAAAIGVGLVALVIRVVGLRRRRRTD